MRNPAGVECTYYYEDFHRGRSIQTCRLIDRDPQDGEWEPGLCDSCPVPAIRRANACPNMVLRAWVVRRWWGLVRRVEVRARCTEYQVDVEDPYRGCGRCHPHAAQVFAAAIRSNGGDGQEG